MQIKLPASNVYDGTAVPDYDWNTYQRGFLGILNNAYNQSCNCGNPKLGTMNDIEQSFAESGGGSWQDFVRFYCRQYNGHTRVRSAIDAMTENLQDRVASIGGAVTELDARWWARKYIWSMLANTYRGFCSERTVIECVGTALDLPYDTYGDESNGIDGYIGDTSVQVKPSSYLGLDITESAADHVITYELIDDDFVFTIPEGFSPTTA
jgi:hypothetical protein